MLPIFFCFCLLFIYDERRDILNKNEEEEVMIVYEENTKRIVIPSGLGNLTGLMEAEAQAMYNSGRTDGYNEGVEDGKSMQDRKLTDSVTFNENGEYDADYGYKKVIVDVDNQWDEGYESGYTDGYASGYTDGLPKYDYTMRITYPMEKDGSYLLWEMCGMRAPFRLNGKEYPYTFEHDHDPWTQPVNNNYIFIKAEGVNGNGPFISVDMEPYFLNRPVEGGSRYPTPDEMTITFGGVPMTVTAWTMGEYDDEYYGRYYQPYHIECEPLSLDQYEIGFSDGYASGYTDGYPSGYTAANEECKKKAVALKVTKWEVIFGSINNTTLSINGIPVDNCGDAGWFQGNPSFIEISGITKESAVTNVQFSYRVIGGIPQTWDTTAYINGVEAEILSQNCVVDGEIYTYTMTFGDVPIVDREAYAQGYAAGQASCPECSGSTDCSEAIEEAFESGYTNGYTSGYSAGQADCGSGCDDYLECRTTVFFAEDTVIPTPSVGVSNYIFHNLDMAYTYVYGAEGWEHNGESLHYIVFDEVTLPAGTYEFKSILKQNGEWYTSGSGSLVMVPNDIIPGGSVGSRFYFNENEQ